MSSKVKHAQRSHRSYKGNYSNFRNFAVQASKKEMAKEQTADKATFAERIKNLFKRQSR